MFYLLLPVREEGAVLWFCRDNTAAVASGNAVSSTVWTMRQATADP